jgi:hypothetical protein
VTDVVCYYHDPIKAPLLREAVLPALAAAERSYPEVRGHVERHWLHGPHVRIRLTGAGADAAAELVAGLLSDHLATCPSTVDIPEPEQRAHADKAGLAELLLPPYEPFRPNNSVHIEPTDDGRINELFNSEALIALRAHGLRIGLPAVRESLTVLESDGDTSQARVRLAVTAMAVQASLFANGMRFGYHSFLSHVEDFLLASDPDGKVRAKFDAIWVSNVEPVTEAVRRVADGRAPDELESAWRGWAIGMRQAGEEAYDRGELAATITSSYGERAYQTGDTATIRRYNIAERTKFSDYHTQLSTVDMEHPLIKRPFMTYRFGINVLYQLLAICDVTPMERYLGASLVATATQRIFDTTWSEQIAAMPRAR